MTCLNKRTKTAAKRCQQFFFFLTYPHKKGNERFELVTSALLCVVLADWATFWEHANKLKQSKRHAPKDTKLKPKATIAKVQTMTINFLGNYFLPHELLCLGISFYELSTLDPIKLSSYDKKTPSINQIG